MPRPLPGEKKPENSWEPQDTERAQGLRAQLGPDWCPCGDDQESQRDPRGTKGKTDQSRNQQHRKQSDDRQKALNPDTGFAKISKADDLADR